VEEAALYEQEHREKHLEHAGKVTELENMLKARNGGCLVMNKINRQ